MISKLLVSFSAVIVLLVAPSYAYAQSADQDIKTLCANKQTANSALCTGYKEGSDDAEDDNPLLRTLTSVINILSFITGVLAVIFVIYGGFKYIISAGDAGKVTSAKNTILYALVGLVVVVVSRQLILFILSKLL